ncbi:outer membrane protein [Aureimonas populi]|uniref:Outer membrane protein n=1 Tax=Aureimonas populi TaxID=1701758 RepID=A0ABW5CH97_9HYPH|nr:YfaZ family outer membrane protein [Aureimonas populi]
MRIRRTVLATLTVVMAASTAASAADMPVYGGMLSSAPELVPVEIGTGWYLRGDVSYDIEQDYDGRAGLYSPFASVSTDYDDLTLDDAFSGGLGIGYQFTDFLRGDITARYGKSDVSAFTDLNGACFFGATCDLRGTAEMETWDLMANAYVDLGTFAGFTPYIGGGLGAVNVSYQDASLAYCDTGLGGCVTDTVGSGEDSWRFAYSLMAGLAYNINRSLAVDIGYRYLNVDGGDMYNLALDGDFAGSGLSSQDDGFDRHSITAGLRYKLW